MLSDTMANAIAHRGPDDAGVWIDSEVGVVLGHRRLAVIDLSAAGQQPMCSQSGRYIIVFNGEIYNHAELRRELEVRCPNGLSWRGNSDTESFLAAIEHYGPRIALEKSLGMFAFALWDRHDRTLYLARDRLGEKPVYYGWQNGVFMFGSELKALAVHPAFCGEVDRDALVLFLRHNYVPSPWTIYTGVKKLAPGTYVKFRIGSLSPRVGEPPRPECYWALRDAIAIGQDNPFEGDSTEAVEALHNVLLDAVGSQTEADVPLGAFLSGGIDSSTMVALMQGRSSRPVQTFTIGFSDPRYNEAIQARAVADHLGTDHTELYASPENALEVIPRLPTLYDEPFSDSSQIPTALLAELTRQHVTVALSGDGGDELFGGYSRYFRARRIWSLLSPVPIPIRRLAGNITFSVLSHWKTQNYLSAKARRIAELLSLESREQLYHGLVSHWKSPAALVRRASEPSTLISNAAMWPEAREFESRMMAIDTLTYLPDDIMVKVDRAAMAASLETRAPFLDHRVVEFAWRLPLSVKIRGGQRKWALRQVLYKYVPEQLVARPKMGFGVPLAAWLRGPLRDWAESLLDERRLRADGFFCSVPIREKWTEHLAGDREWHYYLWDVLMFQAWLDSNRGRVHGLVGCQTGKSSL